MKRNQRAVDEVLRRQFSVISAEQARAAGLTRAQIMNFVRIGRWVTLHPGIYAEASSPATPDRTLMAATLAGGPHSAASHLSAAWWLGLVSRPPALPVITIPHGSRRWIEGVDLRRSRDHDPSRVLVRRGVPYTDPLRVLTDVAADLDADDLAPIVYAALSSKLVTIMGVQQEITRRQSQGRAGPAQLRQLLNDRALIGGPPVSVLEAETIRLLTRYRIPIAGREVHAFPDGRYRIDFLIVERLAVEVDGYAHHWSPEDKAYDDARRNQLRAQGITVLVYDWRAIRFDGGRVAAEIRRALQAA